MSNKVDFHIVGIGASAGGLEALEEFFGNTPSDTGAAYVVVQHLSPNFKSLMDELLARHTKMQITTVEDVVSIQPNTIYLIPPRKNIRVEDGQLRLYDQPKGGKALNFPIDIFFQSLAEEQQEKAIAVVLSGTGSDGSRGIRSISDARGTVIVQEPNSAGFDGMPNSAIATSQVDYVLRPENMATRIRDVITNKMRHYDDSEFDEPIKEENELSLIFALLRKRFQVDFAYYKLPTIMRRIQRRIAFSNSIDLEEYIRRLQEDEGEQDLLYHDLLVEVTQFFRDAEAFNVLASTVIPDIVDNADKEIRVWVPGCATGEEAYSLAILFNEYMTRQKKMVDLKVFATDIHPKSLELASNGTYAADRIRTIPAHFVDTYFRLEESGAYRITKELRSHVIFAPHNLTQDPPFTKLNLISCRNVLIYMRPSTQKKIISYFHFGLHKDGHLMLGPSEHLGDLKDEFTMVDRRWRIFSKRRDVRLGEAPLSTGRPAIKAIASDTEKIYVDGARINRVDDWKELLIDKFAPPSLLLNHQLELMHIFGEAGKYLRQLQGRVSYDIFNLIIPELHTATRAALHRAAREQKKVIYSGIRVDNEDGEDFYLRLSAEPFVQRSQRERYLLLSFERMDDISAPALTSNVDAQQVQNDVGEQVSILERELQYTKEHLQATVEELETTNEELQSTNEELIASNEELQSTNEELHSVNEELYTVNSEYQQKINELMQLTNDMRNLQRSSQVRTLFLDPDHRIRDFTPAAAELFNLLPQDIGRPIEHLLYNLNITSKELREMTARVLESGELTEREVQLPNEVYYYLRVLPYQSDTGETLGVVLTLTNVSRIKAAEASLRASEERYRGVVTDQTELIFRVNADRKMTFVNEKFANYYGVSAEDLLGTRFSPELPEEDSVEWDAKLAQITPESPVVTVANRVRPRADAAWQWQEWVVRGLYNDHGAISEYQGVGRDVTRRKKAVEELADRAEKTRILYEITSQPTHLSNAEQLNYALKRGCELLGMSMGWISKVHDGVCEMGYVHAPDGGLAAGEKFDYELTYCNITLAHKNVAAIEHLGDSDWREHNAYHAFGLETLIGAPVSVHNRFYGAMNFSHPDPRPEPFSEAEQDFVRQLGVWVGRLIEKVQADEALARSMYNLRGVFGAMQDAVILSDEDRKIRLVNAAFTQLYGYEPDEVIGQDVRLLYVADDVYQTIKEKWEANENDTLPIESFHQHKNGETLNVQINRGVVKDDDDKVVGYVGVVRRLTGNENG